MLFRPGVPLLIAGWQKILEGEKRDPKNMEIRNKTFLSFQNCALAISEGLTYEQ